MTTDTLAASDVHSARVSSPQDWFLYVLPCIQMEHFGLLKSKVLGCGPFFEIDCLMLHHGTFMTNGPETGGTCRTRQG